MPGRQGENPSVIAEQAGPELWLPRTNGHPSEKLWPAAARMGLDDN